MEVSFRDRSSGAGIIAWSWNFGDGQTSTEQNPRHTYTTPGNNTVSLTATTASGATRTETKTYHVRALVFEKNNDNVDYPKRHYGSKTLLFRKALEVDSSRLRYSRMFYDSCDVASYYLDTFHRSTMFYVKGSSYGLATFAYLKAYLEGKSDEEVWAVIQGFEPVFDYYNFNRRPSEQ